MKTRQTKLSEFKEFVEFVEKYEKLMRMFHKQYERCGIWKNVQLVNPET